MTSAILPTFLVDGGNNVLTSAPGWLQLGAVGLLIVVLLVAIRVAAKFANSVYADLTKQRDDCQKQAEQLQKDMVALLNTVLPLVTQANTVMSEAMIEVRRMREVR